MRFRVLEESTSSDYCGRNESNMSLITTPNSGNTYYYRSRIPTDLIEHFGGLTEFRLSLKCAIKSRAIRTTKKLDQTVLGLYEKIREGMKSLDIEDIKEILKIEIRKQILHAHHVYEGTVRWNEEGVENSLESVRLQESNLKETLKTDSRTYQKEVDQKLEGILKSLDIEVDRDSINFKKLRNKFIDLYLLRYDWIKDLLGDSEKTDDDFRLNAQQKLKIVLFPELTNPSGMDKKDAFARRTHLQPVIENYAPEPLQPYQVQSNLSQQNTTANGSLSKHLRTFIERKKLEGKSLKEIGSDRVILEEFVEIVGDIDISNVTKKEVSYYIDVQIKLPPNRKKSPKYKDLSIQELVEKNLPEKETQTLQNINKRLTKLSVFANWGVRQGLIVSNPFSGMKFSVKKQPHRRMPFTAEDLRKILDPQTYFKWTINFQHTFRPNRSTHQVPFYWTFLLGIMSGMRTNEMCQIRCSDIRKEKNIWFMFVEDSEETRVKTENAIRKVPVHPQLIELGFIDYVITLKKQKKERVFWELREERDGFASKVSRHFNERFLPAVGVWEKYTKVLYCTRHTFINKLYSEKVDENIIKMLVGHEKEFTMKHYGGDPFTPEVLLEEISKVNYSKINWKKLKL